LGDAGDRGNALEQGRRALRATLRRVSFLMSAIYDRFMESSERACRTAWRAELLAGLEGDVLEIGAGTGLNLPHYPRTLSRLVLSEPDPDMRRKLSGKLRAAGVARAELSDATVDELGSSAGTFDAIVSTLVLCSVPDLDRALASIRKLLRPGGAFVYLEHVAATDRPDRLRWQRRLEPAWRRIAGNCHLARDTGRAIRDAGFVVDHETRESMRKSLSIVRASIRGVARRRA
jgi:SAM-dependent methyltransferase